MKLRIHYHHTDCGGVVYYGRYLDFLEEARTEFFEEKGISIKDLVKKDIIFVVRSQEIQYLKPVFYGELLSVKAKLIEISLVKLVFDYEIINQKDEITTSARTVLVCVDKDFKPTKIPEEILEKLCSTTNK
ncbi:MAG: acyl-CoA thioesterase [Candidatus Omnitrophica bacterium]|nr:acyl-CoA thioesterase [Candidatus Omnitrophota bacterium]